jgi:hypothetical protein
VDSINPILENVYNSKIVGLADCFNPQSNP